MLAPNASNIEGAADSLYSTQSGYPVMSEFIRAAQLKELQSAMGAATAKKLGLTFPLTEEAKVAYLLGIQTARYILAMNPSLAIAGIKPEDVL
jgi:hypothetical protein